MQKIHRSLYDYLNLLSQYLNIRLSLTKIGILNTMTYTGKLVFSLVLFFSILLNRPVCYGQREDLSDRIPKSTKLTYVLDSVLIQNDQVSKIIPTDIAYVFILKGDKAIAKMGAKAKDGIVYIETKNFARKRYWNFLRSKSPEYSKILPNPEKDNLIQYILNGRILKKDYEGELSRLNEQNFKQINILPKDTLLKRYGIYRKQYGIEIFTK